MARGPEPTWESLDVANERGYIWIGQWVGVIEACFERLSMLSSNESAEHGTISIEGSANTQQMKEDTRNHIKVCSEGQVYIVGVFRWPETEGYQLRPYSATEGVVRFRVPDHLLSPHRTGPPGALRGPLRGASMSR